MPKLFMQLTDVELAELRSVVDQIAAEDRYQGNTLAGYDALHVRVIDKVRRAVRRPLDDELQVIGCGEVRMLDAMKKM